MPKKQHHKYQKFKLDNNLLSMMIELKKLQCRTNTSRITFAWLAALNMTYIGQQVDTSSPVTESIDESIQQ